MLVFHILRIDTLAHYSSIKRCSPPLSFHKIVRGSRHEKINSQIIPTFMSIHRSQTLADDIPWGAPVFFAWLMTYFFLIILTRTILSRKQLLSLWTWSVTHEFWFGLASPSSQLLLSFQMSSQPSFQRLAMLLGEQRELGRFLLKLRVIPRAGHCQCTDIFVHSSQIVSHYGPSLPSCNVMQCDRPVCRWYVPPA